MVTFSPKCILMPYGHSWGYTLRFCVAAMLSMLAGAQCVHVFYRPLDNLEDYIKDERQRQQALSGTNRPQDAHPS
uniref:Uncharacterized protein n=1 Tax=Ixodes ricinus TaxID=34613 RepID=A0A147BV29_IXORI